MTQAFLSAAYARRPAPKTYDPSWINVEMARVQKAMPSFVIRKVTTNTFQQLNDGMIVVDCTAGNVNVTLTAPGIASGQPITIKKSDTSAYVVTVVGTIDGTANRTLVNQNDSMVIQSDGTNWFRPVLTASGSATADFTANIITAAGLVVNTATAVVGNIIVDGKAFNTANWFVNTLAVTPNAIAAPDGTLTADLLTTTAVSGNINQAPAGMGASFVTCTVSLKWGNTGVTEFGVYDNTAAAWVLRIRATWTAGAVTALATVAGAGGNYSITAQAGGWYLCSGTTTTAWTAGHALFFTVYPGFLGEAGFPSTVYAWDAKVMPAVNAITATGPSVFNSVVTFAAATVYSALTASQAIFTDASKNAVSKAVTGSGNVVLSGAPTLTGWTAADGLTFLQALGSSTNWATPAAYTSTTAGFWASTTGGATLMGYGTSGDVTFRNRAGTVVAYVGPNTTDFTCVGKLGCNGKAAQGAYSSGGLLAGVVAGLVAMGILSD